MSLQSRDHFDQDEDGGRKQRPAENLPRAVNVPVTVIVRVHQSSISV